MVDGEDGGQESAVAVETAASLGQDAPGFERRGGALVDTAEPRVVTVETLVVANEATTPIRSTHCSAGTEVAFVGEGRDRRIGQRGDEAVARAAVRSCVEPGSAGPRSNALLGRPTTARSRHDVCACRSSTAVDDAPGRSRSACRRESGLSR